ncbi:hypothetical protein [Rhizobium gallicum]|uniref:hypothetical protein n=1 Tax=Rhizobium gallicum TaxID=56730 RepID=UPI001EF85D87|nr:hypothetical protein [Rhizobium gallicum]ULJ74173.1 hypothetical protein L2W42_02885 [Rhizobium gallicum]
MAADIAIIPASAVRKRFTGSVSLRTNMLGFIALHNGRDKRENLIDRSIPQILGAS